VFFKFIKEISKLESERLVGLKNLITIKEATSNHLHTAKKITVLCTILGSLNFKNYFNYNLTWISSYHTSGQHWQRLAIADNY